MQRVEPGIPAGWEGPTPDLSDAVPVPAAGWVGDDIGIVTWGSGSCPPIAGPLDVVATDSATVAFTDSPQNPCTADLSATTHVFRVPEGLTARPIRITVSFEGGVETTEMTLPARP